MTSGKIAFGHVRNHRLSRHPGQVRRAAAALKQRVEHWTFVSTVSVYADNRTTGQRADAAPLRAPTALEIEHRTEETYGAAKVACEQAIGENTFICRAGLIVGPEDPHAAQVRLTGYFDGIGPSYTRGQSLAECATPLARPARSPGSTARFWKATTSGAGLARARCRCGSRCQTMRASPLATRHRRAIPA